MTNESGKEETGDDSATDPDSHEYTRVTAIHSENLGFFQRMAGSMRNLDFYALVLAETGKQAFLYCVKLCLLIGLLSGLIFGVLNWTIVDRISTQLQQQLPPVTISNGDVTVDSETPYRLTLLDKHELLLDPDAERNRLQLDPRVMMVLVDGAIYVRSGEKSFNAWRLEPYLGNGSQTKFVIDASTIKNWTSFFKWTLVIASCIGLMIGVLVQGFLRVLLISVGGFFAIESESALFGWRRFLKISCYAVTPLLIVEGVILAFELNVPFRDWFLLGGGTVFVYLIVKHLEDRLEGIKLDFSGETGDEWNSAEDSKSDYEF